MVDSEVDQRVMDLVRMFLATSSRGDHAVLVLESRKQQITTKYRSVEKMAGSPAPTSTRTKKKENPARARRSKLRLEQFLAKKEEEKLKKQQTGSQTAAGCKLILDLANEGQVMPVGTGLLSPILQVDGEVVEEDQAKYSFVSMYAEEDIIYTIDEIFPRSEVICTFESRVRVEPLSAHHLCILKVKAIVKGRSLCWPLMNASQAVVFEEIKTI